MGTDIDASHLLVPSYYAENDYPHETWTRMRREDPVHRVEDWDGPPYWALTRRAETIEVSRQPSLFLNSPRTFLQPGGDDLAMGMGSIQGMDPPEHRQLRSLLSARFTPNALKRIYDHVDEITHQVLDAVSTGGEIRETEFVESISARIPIWVIAEMLGVPRDDWEQLYLWTNELVGSADPEYQHGRSEEATRDAAHTELTSYFEELVEQRRADPRDDLVSLLAHAEIDGKNLEDPDLLIHLTHLIVAGNETTRQTITGGLYQLIQHPDQFERLHESPALLESFVEEALRYVSPVIHLCRTAAEDAEVGGKKIRAGDTLVIFYPSANRDEAFYDRPQRLRHRPRTEPPPRLRDRRALLPGHPCGAPRAAHPVPPPDPAAAARRAGETARAAGLR